MDCNKIYLKMDRYETVVFCNDDVNVYVLCGKAEGKDIYIDPRYEVALGDYKEMLEVIFTTRNKYSTVDSVHDDLRQSVSTGRNSIIKEGYNS